MTPTQRDSVPAKSPVSVGDPTASHSPFDPHHRPVVPGEVYRAHLPPHLDPTLAFHRVLDPGTVLNRQYSAPDPSSDQHLEALCSFVFSPPVLCYSVHVP